MRIAVMSDLHDNIPAWDMILREINSENIKVLINCGDTATASALRRIAKNFSGQIHDVYGNNAVPEEQQVVARECENLVLHGEVGGVELDGYQVGFTHFPQVAEAMAKSGEFDLVCHGHTHLKRWEKIGDCYILNPGTAGGVFQYPSFAIVDLDTMKAQFIDPHL